MDTYIFFFMSEFGLEQRDLSECVYVLWPSSLFLISLNKIDQSLINIIILVALNIAVALKNLQGKNRFLASYYFRGKCLV